MNHKPRRVARRTERARQAARRKLADGNGWHGHTVLRWFMLATIIVAIGLALLAAARRKISLPIAPSAILTALAGLTTILVAYRVVINEPGPNQYITVKAGAWLGLISLIGVTVGGYLAMKEEGVSFSDAGEQARSAFDTIARPEGGDGGGSSVEPPPAESPPPAQ